MSVSPQPPPQAAVRSPPELGTPVVASLSHATLGADSPAQLASLLSNSLQENENLRRELASVKRRAEKAERLVSSFQKFSATGGSPNPSGSGNSTPANGQFDEATARSVVLDCEARAEHFLVERDELTARINCLQEGWAELDHFLYEKAVEATEARARFSLLMNKRGGDLVVVGDREGLPVAAALSQQAARDSRAPRPSPHLSVRTSVPTSRSGVPLSAQQYGSMPVPPPASQNSRVRPRAGSLDGSYSHLTGPGGPPPSKRMRSDREYERDMQLPPSRPYSQSVSTNSQASSMLSDPYVAQQFSTSHVSEWADRAFSTAGNASCWHRLLSSATHRASSSARGGRTNSLH